LSSRVRARIESATTPIDRRPQAIRDWVESKFQDAGPKLFLELGAHRGADTSWLAELPDVTLHAFEPDPRNVPPSRANVTFHRAAVCDRDGRGPLILSREGWGREWTYSSSLHRPKNHLQRFPVTFGDAVEVELVALDTFWRRHRLGLVDFVWADVQGAESDVVRGGLAALHNTRYLYTEFSNDELYEGQATLAEILALLPEFRVLELWPEDVLLENRRLAA
jgi:FkbM family methyltransferase